MLGTRDFTAGNDSDVISVDLCLVNYFFLVIFFVFLYHKLLTFKRDVIKSIKNFIKERSYNISHCTRAWDEIDYKTSVRNVI